MRRENAFIWRDAVKLGSIGGIILVFVSLVGMVAAFDSRFIISETLTLGALLLLVAPFTMGYLIATRSVSSSLGKGLLYSLLGGLVNGLVLALLLFLGTSVNLRSVFINASPELFDILQFGLESVGAAIALLIVGGGLLAVAGALVDLLPNWLRRALVTGAVLVILFGILQELLSITFGSKDWYDPVDALIFAQKGLSWTGTAVIFLLGFIVSSGRHFFGARTQRSYAGMSDSRQRTMRLAGFVLGGVVLLLLPPFFGPYPSEILTTVGIYIIMGMGLNIVVGFAGLLDLGYVAFFAIGAYTMGVLTTTGKFATMEWSFWLALPFAVLLSLFAGVLLGIPVLKMRGDYLAIVTLGFGEIIRILALSDWLKPYIGGAQGILQIPKPELAGLTFKGPQQIYYLVLIGIVLVGYVAWRLRDARMGRAWKAMREDEDVAEAMGINLVNTKLLAFATGAAFAGLSGALFTAKLGSIFPHSFNLIVSINVLSLIIVGGIGSLPGVVVGAFILVGMPELLREFADYRMLMYGALLVVMMLVKPEGFWPEATRRLELHDVEETEAVVAGRLAPDVS